VLDHVEHWAKANNLKLNRAKSREVFLAPLKSLTFWRYTNQIIIIIIIIVTFSHRSKRGVNLPPCLSGVVRVTALKILGVIITVKQSMSEHVRDVVQCAQSLHVIRVLRCRGIDDQALQAVYRSVVVAKLLYAASAWWGFTSADDRHRIEAVVRRGVMAGL